MAEAAPRPAGLSVVIPSYGRPSQLLEAVQSVATSYPDRTEILVIDDATPGGPPADLPVRNDFQVPIRLYVQHRNRGPQAARNLGIRRARFSHIAFLDADDRFMPDKIDRLLPLVTAGGWDLLFHPVIRMERAARIARWWNASWRSVFGFRTLLCLLNPIATPGLIVRRRCRLGIPTMRYAEDYAFLLRFADPSIRVCFLDEALSAVGRAQGSPGGLSADVRRMRKGEFLARRVLLKRPSLGNLARWLLGSAVGLVRVASDIVRGRYVRG